MQSQRNITATCTTPFGKAAVAAMLLLLAGIVFGAAATPAQAGYWTYTCTLHGTPQTYNGDGPEVGQGAAFDHWFCLWPNAPTPGCQAPSWAKCSSYSQSPVCANSTAGPWPCEGIALHGCYANENPVGTRCCKKNDKKCIAQASKCKQKRANPVEVESGDKVETVIDFTTEGPRPLQFVRHYRSNFKVPGDATDLTKTMLGRAWRSNFDTVLSFEPPTSTVGAPVDGDIAQVALPEGEVLAFVYDSTALRYLPAYYDATFPHFFRWVRGRTDVNYALDFTNTVALKEFRLRLPDDTVYAYTFAGALKEIRWPDGYKQTMGGGHSVTDSLGRYFDFTTSPTTGYIDTLTVPGGQVIRYSYLARMKNISGQLYTPYYAHDSYVLEKVAYPDATPANLADNPTVKYHYENTNFVYALTGITDERGVRYATWAYDTEGRVISSTHAGGADTTTFSYDDVNNTRTVTNPLGRQTVYRYTYGQGGSVPLLTEVDGIATTNCAASDTSYAYDTNGFVNQKTDAEGRITQYVNNARGLPTSMTEGFGTPEARTTTYAWHATLNQPTQIAAPRLTSAMTYDTAGRLLTLTQTDTTSHTVPYSTNGQTRTWTYTYCTAADTNCPVGQLKSVNGPLSGTGDTVTYTYDATGFVATITNEVGHVTTVVTKNPLGQPTKVRDANLVDTDLTYDERFRLKTSAIAGATTTYTYDATGNVTRITRPDGSYLNYTYDSAKRVTLIANNTNEKIELAYNANGDVTSRKIKTAGNAIVFQHTQAFDELGRLLRSIGAVNQTTVYSYDRTDLHKTTTDPRSILFSKAYDALQRLKSETGNGVTTNYGLDPQGNLATYTDPRAIATSYVRNGWGEAIRETSPDAGTTTYTRNALGDVTQMTDGRAVVTNYSYDNAGRMLTRTFPAATAENVTYTWDSIASGNKGKGRITSAADQSGSTSWVYDARGNVTSETRVIQGKSYTTAYVYNAGDKVTQITYPSGRIVTIARNALGQISGITTKKNAAAAVANVATGVTWSAMSDLVTGFTYGNGLTFAATYDLDYRIATLKVKNGTTDTISQSFGYSDNVNLTSIADTLTAANNQTFTYTGLGRLQNATGVYGAYTFSVDPVGNRTQEVKTVSGTTTTKVLGYPATSNRLSSETTNGTLSRSFTYDGAGNMLTGLPSGSVYSFDYNKRNRPSALKQSGTTVTTYLYNALEQLSSRAVSSPLTPVGTTHYLYDLDGRLIAEAFGNTAATAVLVREYIWLEGMPVMAIDGVNTATPVLMAVHTDHLTRPIRMTNASKTQVWNALWTPFGTAHAITGSATQNLRFPGQYFLIEQGLHYNWHRFYDPTTGRYTQPDPLGFVDGPSRYAYALNSPLMYTDDTGLAGQIPTPPPGIEGGPWTANPANRPGNYVGPKQPTGPRTQLQWVPPEKQGGPPGSQGYWKKQKPGGGWERFDRQGKPITPDEAHPNPKPPQMPKIPSRGPMFPILPPELFNECAYKPWAPECLQARFKPYNPDNAGAGPMCMIGETRAAN
jgi:RHS repeat-associated protein